MDLIAQLTQTLGIGGHQAEGLAGGLLGTVKNLVQEKLGPEPAQQMESAVPEMKGWSAAVPAGDGASAGLGGLGGLAGSLLGAGSGGGLGGLMGALAPLAGKLSLDPSKLTAALPLVLGFLKSRLDPALLAKITSAVPFLTGASGDEASAAGGLAGALGGNLGGKVGGKLGGLFGKS